MSKNYKNWQDRFDTEFSIDPETGCKNYLGGKLKEGYGQIWVDGKTMTAHRLAWTLTYGKISDGLQVLHKCDNPHCYNVDHLFLGTLRDNMKDKIKKGRGGQWPFAKKIIV